MTKSIDEIKSEILSAQKTGDYLKEYDLAQAALKLYPDNEFFQYCSVLSLTKCNAKQRALDLFYSYKLYLSEDEYIRALEPRILKGLAFLKPTRENFIAAATKYHLAFAKTGGHYSAINAATFYMLSGDRRQATELATTAIKIAIEDLGPQYFPLTTQAEAYLLLNRKEDAMRFIGEAAKYNENNLQTRARTCQQLRLICRYLDIDQGILDPLLPETVIHYCGHIFDSHRPLSVQGEHELYRQIENLISNKHCAVAYGSLAAGSDIMFAEAILKQGGELNIWLPFGVENFCEVMVQPVGDTWVKRFYNCMEKANSISCATESIYLGDDTLFRFCSDVAMGMAIMRANSLNAKLMQLAVWDQNSSDQVASTYSNIAKWRELGHHSEIIPCPAKLLNPFVRKSDGDYPKKRREPHAILFSDVEGYSKLNDRDILWFYDKFQPALARAIEEFRPEIQHLDTWGDAIFLVTEKASVTARIAIALNNVIAEFDQTGLSLGEPLLMRIGLHFGPVYKLYDHLSHWFTYSSNDVTKTARIEPVTPPGEIFGTEPFVAMLELEGVKWASFEYAGTIPSAKDYGAFRMFHVRQNSKPILLTNGRQ